MGVKGGNQKRKGEKTMEKGKATFEEILKWMEVVRKEGWDLFYGRGNKSAGKRARRALDRIAKLKVQWRKETCGSGDE